MTIFNKSVFASAVLCVSISWSAAQETFTPEDTALFDRSPSPFFDMPPSFFDLQMEYSESSESLRCSLATEDLYANVPTESQSAISYWKSASEGGAVATFFDKFFASCTSETLGPAYPDSIKSSLDLAVGLTGIFFLKAKGTWVPFCVGVRVSATEVATAKHCFFDPGHLSLYNALLPPGAKSDTSVAFPLGLGEKVFFVQMDHPFVAKEVSLPEECAGTTCLFFPLDPSRRGEDVIKMHVPSVDDGHEEFAGVKENEVNKWDKLAFVSLQMSPELYAHFQSLLSGELSTENSTLENAFASLLRSSVRLDLSPNCYAFFESSGCIFHSCQTIAGFSGSPLFSIDRNRGLSLVGIHSGSTANSNGDGFESFCGFDRGKWVRNFGSSLNWLNGSGK